MGIYLTNEALNTVVIPIYSSSYLTGSDVYFIDIVKGGDADSVTQYMIATKGDWVGTVMSVTEAPSTTEWRLLIKFDPEVYIAPSGADVFTDGLIFYRDGYNIGDTKIFTNKTKTGFYGDSHKRYSTIVDYEIKVATKKINVANDGLLDILISQDLFMSTFCVGGGDENPYPYRVVWLDESLSTVGNYGRFTLNFGVGNQNRYRL